MIVTEKIEIKVCNKNVGYYKSKGYDCKVNETIIVKLEDLSKGSHEKIKIKCDICGKENEMTYHSYNVNFYNCDYHYSCSKCSKEKTKKTNLKRYGVEHVSQSKEIREKIKKTNLEKYGVENVSQLTEIREKAKKTNLERYGVEYALQNDDLLNKCKKTNLERYGVEHPAQNSEIYEKNKKTCLEKYGVENPLQNDDILNKVKKTNFKRYGVKNISQNDDIKKKKEKIFNKKYGGFLMDSEITKEKIIKTNLEKYGVEYPLQNLEIFNKVQKSAHHLKKYKKYTYRGTYELDFLIKFSDNYEIENVDSIDYLFEGKKKKYYPDYYLPKYNLIVEIKSSYTYEREKEKNEAKKEATISNGFNFIFIINKNYSEFISILEE